MGPLAPTCRQFVASLANRNGHAVTPSSSPSMCRYHHWRRHQSHCKPWRTRAATVMTAGSIPCRPATATKVDVTASNLLPPSPLASTAAVLLLLPRSAMTEEEAPTHSLSLRLASSKNSIVKSTLRTRHRRQQKRNNAERRRKRQREQTRNPDETPEKEQPRTIESSRIYDEQTGQPLTREQALAITDEFTPVLAGEKHPNIVVTTGLKATDVSFDFVRQILPVLFGATYFERLDSSISDFCTKAVDKGFTDVVLIKEDKKALSTLTHVHLPSGPTAIYKISSFVPTQRIRGHGRCTAHKPEVILNNFNTALGLRVARMLASLFSHTPNFVGRQVATFHNQRDFVFFRFHRYVFNAARDKARLQELGPRFTLKLRALQKGVFQHPDVAEHEFRWKTKTDVNRRRFFL